MYMRIIMGQDNKKTILLGVSVVITLICFGLCVYFSLWAFLGGLPAQGLIMILGWLPCVGLVILEVIVYIYGLYCRKTNKTEARKMNKSTWVLGILTNAYIWVVSLFFIISDFANLSRYLIVCIPAVLNFLALIFGAKLINKKNKV